MQFSYLVCLLVPVIWLATTGLVTCTDELVNGCSDCGGVCRAHKCNKCETESAICSADCRNERVCCLPCVDCADDCGGRCRAHKCDRYEKEYNCSSCGRNRVCCV
ncbi:uncharacterized protein LOC102803540 [Saccoglossus kowalevskii]|uniref:Uncharacterized protein LOC102803540 n=1 Tax=Saccoglossus kowalevskii TaxID=10224 RepID=A0ABM0MF54_SACKO|nr:PREDICTED: uncharacterized protein LOC102803540 [Saccoglossus kowalevskii]